jgi:phospholipid transport system substrate-binding protein
MFLGVALSAIAGISQASAEAPAEVIVRETTAKVMGVLGTEQGTLHADPNRIFELVEDYIAPHFDLDRMSRRVLGKQWRGATAEQRARFVSAFKKLLIRTYATALREYSDQTVSYLPSRRREGRNAISVRTQINLSDGPPIPITYEMYLNGEAWKVYDVVIDGVSLVINYRSSFAAEVRKGGLDGLIGRMEEHNRARTPTSGDG